MLSRSKFIGIMGHYVRLDCFTGSGSNMRFCSLQLSRAQGTFALPHISIRNTKLQDTCPPLSRCNPRWPYRTNDGSCNNEKHPDFGKAGTAFQRVLENKYTDGVNSPREFSVTGQPLPSPR